jgi:trigger factor
VRVNVERLPGSTVELDIYADDLEFAEAVEKAYRKVAREISIPGFRKGKAPRNIVEGMVGRDAIVEEAGRDMMDDLYRQAIEQEALVPVGDPRVGILQPEPIGFKVTIEVFPTVTLGDYASVRVEPREVEIEESEVQEVLNQLQIQNAEWVAPAEQRSPQDGDKVTLDLLVYDGDEQFQEPAEDAEFVLGESPMFDTLVEAIKMMAPGSTAEMTLAFDDDDVSVNELLRGKELRYVITLKDVQQRDLPELNDELAQKAGDFQTVAELRAAVEKDLLRNKATQTRAEVATETINAMAEVSEVDVPASMIDKEIEDELTQLRSRLAQQGVSLDDYLQANAQTMDELREEYRPNAERRLRNSMVLQEIAKAEGLEVTDQDIAEEIGRLSAGAENPERLESLYQSDYFRGLLENEVFDRKLTDRVIEIATEGVGAVTGSGAEALKEAMAPPTAAPVEVEVTGTESGDDTAPVAVDEASTEEAIDASGMVEADAEAEAGSGQAQDASAADDTEAGVNEAPKADAQSGADADAETEPETV